MANWLLLSSSMGVNMERIKLSGTSPFSSLQGKLHITTVVYVDASVHM